MKLKALVILSSFFVLITLIICVSVYAYNAYAFKIVDENTETVTMRAAVNGWGILGLDDGVYSMSAKVGFAENRVDDIRYADGNDVSEWLEQSGSSNKKGQSHAYITGWDPTYVPIKKVSARGSAFHDPRE